MLVSGFSFNLFPPIFKNLNHASPPSTNEYDLINKDFNLLNKGNSFCNKNCKLTRKKVILNRDLLFFWSQYIKNGNNIRLSNSM